MITTEERKSIKCPTDTSLFVSFNYNQNIVAVVKNLGFSIYNAKTKEWEVGLQYLSDLITKLSMYDEITLNILPTNLNEEKADVVYPIEEIKTPLFDYQKDGVQYGLNHDKWLLLDATGLGKSLTMISLAYNLKMQGKVNKVLVICGINALKTNWKKEIEKHSDLSCRILGEYKTKRGTLAVGGVKDRLAQLKSPIKEFFTITNIETLRDDGIIKELTKKKAVNKFDMIIVDEIHRCLVYDSLIQTSQGMLPIGYICENKLNCEVLSKDVKSGRIEYKPITDWHILPCDDNLVELEIEDNGVMHRLRCTEHHKIYTNNRGWVEAKDLTEFDDICVN